MVTNLNTDAGKAGLGAGIATTSGVAASLVTIQSVGLDPGRRAQGLVEVEEVRAPPRELQATALAVDYAITLPADTTTDPAALLATMATMDPGVMAANIQSAVADAGVQVPEITVSALSSGSDDVPETFTTTTTTITSTTITTTTVAVATTLAPSPESEDSDESVASGLIVVIVVVAVVLLGLIAFVGFKIASKKPEPVAQQERAPPAPTPAPAPVPAPTPAPKEEAAAPVPPPPPPQKVIDLDFNEGNEELTSV